MTKKREAAPALDAQERFQKENGLTRGLMNSIALFTYHAYPGGPGDRDAIDVFNEWATATGTKFDDADGVCAALEHVRMTMNVDREDLARALEWDALAAGQGGIHERSDRG